MLQNMVKMCRNCFTCSWIILTWSHNHFLCTLKKLSEQHIVAALVEVTSVCQFVTFLLVWAVTSPWLERFQNYWAQKLTTKRQCVQCINQVSSSNVKVTLWGQFGTILLVCSCTWPWQEGFQNSLRKCCPQWDNLLHAWYRLVAQRRGHLFTVLLCLGCYFALVGGISFFFFFAQMFTSIRGQNELQFGMSGL